MRAEPGGTSPVPAQSFAHQPRAHFWLAPPLHDQISTGLPLAVPPLVTSRQRPDSAPTTVPSEFSVHCWFAPPLQSQICTLVPAVVAWPGTSRHLLPYTCSSPLDSEVHCWFAPPLQSQMS